LLLHVLFNLFYLKSNGLTVDKADSTSKTWSGLRTNPTCPGISTPGTVFKTFHLQAIYITGVCKIRLLSYKSRQIILNTWIVQVIKEERNAEVNITYIRKNMLRRIGIAQSSVFPQFCTKLYMCLIFPEAEYHWHKSHKNKIMLRPS
jgi:hypothetical protein